MPEGYTKEIKPATRAGFSPDNSVNLNSYDAASGQTMLQVRAQTESGESPVNFVVVSLEYDGISNVFEGLCDALVEKHGIEAHTFDGMDTSYDGKTPSRERMGRFVDGLNQRVEDWYATRPRVNTSSSAQGGSFAEMLDQYLPPSEHQDTGDSSLDDRAGEADGFGWMYRAKGPGKARRIVGNMKTYAGGSLEGEVEVTGSRIYVTSEAMPYLHAAIQHRAKGAERIS